MKRGRASKYTHEQAEAMLRVCGSEPLVPYPSSTAKRWESRCLAPGCGAVGYPRLNNLYDGSGQRKMRNGKVVGSCDTCGRRVSDAKRRIPDEVAVAIVRAAGWEPQVRYPGVTTPWPCLCLTCGQVMSPHLQTVRRGHGCRSCAGLWVDPMVAAVSMRAAGFEPLEAFPGALKQWRCRCLDPACGKEVTPTYANAVHQGSGCGKCAGFSTADEAVDELAGFGFAAIDPFPGVKNPWRAWCERGQHEAYPYLSVLRAGRKSCGFCAGKRIHLHEAAERMESYRFTPLETYPGRNNAAWLCRCHLCDQEVSTTLAAASAGGGRSCCAATFLLSPPWRTAGLYLVVHDKRGAIKVGIGLAVNGIQARVAEHVALGWRVAGQWHGLHTVAAARQIEQSVLRDWRSRGLPVFLRKADMPQEGYTETAELTQVNVPVTKRKITLLVKRDLVAQTEVA